MKKKIIKLIIIILFAITFSLSIVGLVSSFMDVYHRLTSEHTSDYIKSKKEGNKNIEAFEAFDMAMAVRQEKTPGIRNILQIIISSVMLLASSVSCFLWLKYKERFFIIVIVINISAIILYVAAFSVIKELYRTV